MPVLVFKKMCHTLGGGVFQKMITCDIGERDPEPKSNDTPLKRYYFNNRTGFDL